MSYVNKKTQGVIEDFIYLSLSPAEQADYVRYQGETVAEVKAEEVGTFQPTEIKFTVPETEKVVEPATKVEDTPPAEKVEEGPTTPVTGKVDEDATPATKPGKK